MGEEQQHAPSGDNQPLGKDKDVEDNKAIACLSYIGILFIVPLLAKKDSKFAMFHAKQGLVLFIAEIVISVVNIIPVLGQIIWFIALIIFLVFSIMGIIKALQGQYWELPVLGSLTKKFNL